MNEKIRQELAEKSILKNSGEFIMEEPAKTVWSQLLDHIRNVDFKKIWCQYSEVPH